MSTNFGHEVRMNELASYACKSVRGVNHHDVYVDSRLGVLGCAVVAAHSKSFS